MRVGIIGIGNMGSLLAHGLTSKDYKLNLSKRGSKIDEFKEKDVEIFESNKDLAKNSDLVILAVKPYVIKEVIAEIRESITAETIIVSIAAGISLDDLSRDLASNPVATVMPNVAARVNEAMSVISVNNKVDESTSKAIKEIFDAVGKAIIIDQKQYSAAAMLAGCTPAFGFLFIEALADGAVYQGLKRDKAYEISAQAVLGAAKLVSETGMHPAELKDMVTSPAGTTIAGIKALEELGFRNAAINAIIASIEKNDNM